MTSKSKYVTDQIWYMTSTDKIRSFRLERGFPTETTLVHVWKTENAALHLFFSIHWSLTLQYILKCSVCSSEILN